MFAKKWALLGAATFALGGCQQPWWNKPGASTDDFNADKYQCMQGSQQQTSSAYISRYGGSASSGQSTNEPLFAACMNAKGWTLGTRNVSSDQAAQNNAEVEAAFKGITEKQAQQCADPKFEPYYSKTACLADKITFEQLADKSKISPAARAIFVEQRSATDTLNRELLDLQRKYGGAMWAKRADLYVATAKVQNDKNNLDLYNGQITWGDYNRRRQEIHSEYMAAAKKIT